jgi:hypothetical protein
MKEVFCCLSIFTLVQFQIYIFFEIFRETNNLPLPYLIVVIIAFLSHI